MSRTKILIFLLAVYALIAGLCLAIPADGLSAGPFTILAPDLKEAFVHTAKAPAGPSPEEIIAAQSAAVRQAEQDKFQAYFKENPARIHFPDDDLTLFDDFFAALDGAGKTPVRILHYGDSQIEEDRITSAIRAGLQKRFGGGGPGLMPFGRPYYTAQYSQTSTATLDRALVFGEGSRRSDGRYGVMGQLARIDTSVYTTAAPIKSNSTPSRHFNRFTLLAGNVQSLNVKVGSTQYKIEKTVGPEVRRLEIALPDSSSSVRFSAWGSADIYGFSLDDSHGVSVDNIPMRGCAGTVFTRMNASQLKEYVDAENVRLIILQFGGNAMPYRKTEKAISEYKSQLETQIQYLKSIAPDADILF